MLKSGLNRCFAMTPPGVSALATIRIAGPGVRAFLGSRFSKEISAGRPVHGELRDDSGVIDDPVVVLREDGFAAEITLHGGAWISRCAITLAERDGFRPSPIDVETIGSTDAATLFEHEMLVSLRLARTELAARTLLAQPQAWQQLGATDEYAHPCLGTTKEGTDKRPHPWHPEAVLTDRSLEFLLNPPTLAIVGLPNAGKSTLANRLFGQQRSIVSPLAGTTRDWVGEEANLDGLIVKLIDTPGRRMTEDAIEHAAIRASDVPIEAADAVVLLLDATRGYEEQQPLIRQFAGALLVVNKIDARLPLWTDEHVAAIGATCIAAEKGLGVAELVVRLRRHFGVDENFSRPRAWTHRQRELLRQNGVADILA